MRRLLFDNLSLKLLAAVLAGILFFYVQSEREVTTTLTPQLVLQVPEGMMNTSPVPDRLKVVVSGSWGIVSTVGRQEPPPVQVDLTTFSEGPVTYYLDEDLIRLPAGLRITSITPAAVNTELERVISRRVPVVAKVQGEPAFGYRMGSPRLDPGTVTLVGPRREVQALQEVPTEPIDVDGATTDVVRQTRLVIAQPNVNRQKRDPLTVTIPVTETIQQRDLENLLVALPPDLDAVVRPDTVTLTVAGPMRLVEPLTSGSVKVTVPAARVPPPGEQANVALEVSLPEGVRLVGAPPKVAVERPRAAAP